jgi:hypothetical protein
MPTVDLTVNGFNSTDTILVRDPTLYDNLITGTATFAAGTLSLANFGSVFANLDLAGVDSSSVFSVGAATIFGGESQQAISIACFAAGTRIGTPSGMIPVERLAEGDMVQTESGTPRPVRWIGRRSLDCRRHPRPDAVLPVRIAPHAFGQGRPNRALRLSPDHAVFVEDALIPIKLLINGTTIRQVAAKTVTYYHIELPQHDVVLAEGLPVETYLECGNRDAYENGGGVMQLYPDFTPDPLFVAQLWDGHGYAPLLVQRDALAGIERKLASQSLLLGYQTGEAAPAHTKRRARAFAP